MESSSDSEELNSGSVDVSKQRHQIEADRDFFKSFIDLVPARTFFNADTKRKIRGEDSDSDSDSSEGEGFLPVFTFSCNRHDLWILMGQCCQVV